MDAIETAGIAVGLLLLAVETTVLIRMQSHVKELQELAKRLDEHVNRMDEHIGLMDERVGNIKSNISLVCDHFGVDSDKHENNASKKDGR